MKEPIMTSDVDLIELYRLGETLPEPMSRAAINGFVATRGLEATQRRLIRAHAEQCRTLCQHFKEMV